MAQQYKESFNLEVQKQPDDTYCKSNKHISLEIHQKYFMCRLQTEQEWAYQMIKSSQVAPPALAKRLKEDENLDYGHCEVEALHKKCLDVWSTTAKEKTKDLGAHLGKESKTLPPATKVFQITLMWRFNKKTSH
jgi:predicted secreted protein